MPRRNENARPRFQPDHDNWRRHELWAMSNMVDKKTARHGPESLSEEIVREFRKSEGLDLGRALTPIKPISKIRPRHGIRWYRKINWNVALQWICLILAILLVIIELLIFSSFSSYKPAKFGPPFYRYPHDNVRLDLKERNHRYE